MSLDGKITHIEKKGADICLTLGPRKMDNGSLSTPGQPEQVIKNATVLPCIGDELWGGSGSVLIESSGISFPYKRKGYIQLVQDW